MSDLPPSGLYRRWSIWHSPTGRYLVTPPRDLERHERGFTAETLAEAKDAIDAWHTEYEEDTLWARNWSPWPLLAGTAAALALTAALVAFALTTREPAYHG